MRYLIFAALAGLTVAPALADVVVDPSAPWPQRINTCVAEWYRATPVQQGTMTYRQFTTKCVGGKTALPFRSKALCQDGTVDPGSEPGGACARNGGIAEWLK